MTHAERRKRRKAIARSIGGGISIERVCAEFGVGTATARNAFAEFTSSRQKQRLLKWQTLDWKLRDVDLARAIGLSRERIRQLRNKLRQPKSPNHRTQLHLAPEVIAGFREWVHSSSEAVGEQTIRELSDRFGLKKSIVQYYLEKFGVKARPAFLGLHLTKENLRSFCEIDAVTGCWKLPTRFKLSHRKKIRKEYANRRVFKWFHGHLPSRLLVLNTCGDRQCINPEHLFAGGRAEERRYRATCQERLRATNAE
jgi:transposase-like protein